jgi:hypothetical protein
MEYLNKEILQFCIYCGQKVKLYKYSSHSYGDVYDYGNDIYSLVDLLKDKPVIITYQCQCCDRQLLAPNLFDTGICCEDCGAFMNLFARYCGVCSKKIHYF